MSVYEALVKAYSLLNGVTISICDARKAGEAMELLEASINALRERQSAPANDKKEESK